MGTKQKSPLSEIELTADGSHTLFVPSMNEHYHSVNGAKTEAEHLHKLWFQRKLCLSCQRTGNWFWNWIECFSYVG